MPTIELHLIDLDLTKYDLDGSLVSYQLAGEITLHQADSSETMRSFPAKHFDFVYIDGDHSYEGVVRDIDASAEKAKDDGFLIFNDYTMWSPWECMPYGVMEAVNEFCIRND